MRTGSQHDDNRIRRTGVRQGQKRFPLCVEKSRQLPHIILVEDARKCSRTDESVLQCVSHPRRNLRPIRNDPPSTIRRARQIRGIRVQMNAPKRRDPHAWTKETGTGKKKFGGQKPIAKQPLRAIKIHQHRIQERGALSYSAFNSGPFRTIDNERNGIHRPLIIAGFFNISGVVRHTLRLDDLLSGLPAAVELLQTKVSDFDEQMPPVTPWNSTGQHDLIPMPRYWLVLPKALLHRLNQYLRHSVSRISS